MEGYTKNTYTKFSENDEDEEEDGDVLKKRVKYAQILKEESFLEEEEE